MDRTRWFFSVARLSVKDIRVARRFLWVVVPMYLAYGAALFVSTTVFVFVNGLFMFFLSVAPVLLDYRYNSDLLYCSLPVRRSAVVAGRYLGAVLIVVLGMAACAGYGSLLKMLFTGVSSSFSLQAVGGKLVPVGAATLLFVCAFYPFVFWHGLGKAIYLFVFSMLGVAGFSLVAGGIAWRIRQGSLVGYSSRAVAAFIVRAVTDGRGAWQELGRPGAAALFGGIACAVMAGSYALSTRFYGRRDF